MIVSQTPIADLLVVDLEIHHDDRGFFVERYNQQKFYNLGLPTKYFQDNYSISKPGVIRGLHFQNNPSQAKLVGCVSGKILDVAVDIRKESPTFGKHFSIELSAFNGKMLYIPEGFAHGFSVIGNESAGVLYKVNNQYSKNGEGGIIFDDADLNIDWRVKNPNLSKKDLELQTFKQYKNLLAR